MRGIIILLLGLCMALSGYSQQTADIGFWGGGSNYLGDIENQPFTRFSFPTVGAFFRYNLHYRTSLRAQALFGNVAGEGLVLTNQPHSFSKYVTDIALMVEINYLQYMLGSTNHSFSSYLLAGGGVMFYGHETPPFLDQSGQSAGTLKPVTTPTIPFGMGFKFNIGSRLGLGVEYQMRKLFDDKLDNLDDPLKHKINGEEKESTYTKKYFNNDWVGFLGLHLTYKIYLGSKSCPVYDAKN